jgi:plastocyanin
MLGRGSLVLTASFTALLVFTAGQAVGLGGADEVSTAQDVPVKARVLVHDNYFEPRSVEILDEGQVHWRWRGENRHSIRFTKVPARAGRKGAGLRAKGKWKRKFHKPGVYRYVCTQWSGMRGTVTVRKVPKPPPEPGT